MPGRDQALVRIAFEELDDPHPAGRFRYDLNCRHIRDQEADPCGSELRWGRLDAIGNHAKTASDGHRGGELGRSDAAERRELERQPTADEAGEARVHYQTVALKADCRAGNSDRDDLDGGVEAARASWELPLARGQGRRPCSGGADIYRAAM
jgi:hypothetical protein